jgi:hypothetical protein
MSLSERFWAAGFLDGEGSFLAVKNHRNRGISLRSQANQVDRRPLDRLAAALGGRVTGPMSNGKGRTPMFRWLGDRHSASKVLPFLSEPKLDQLDAARVRIADIRGLREYDQ